MTDIRRHGFESNAQWREYLEDIEEANGRAQAQPSEDGSMFAELADLRADVAALRGRIEARLRRRGRWVGWQRVAGAMAFLLLLTLANR